MRAMTTAENPVGRGRSEWKERQTAKEEEGEMVADCLVRVRGGGGDGGAGGSGSDGERRGFGEIARCVE